VTTGEVPPGVVTVMSTVPAEPVGEVAEHKMVVEQLTEVAAKLPKLAVVVALPVMKPVPVMATTVPAVSGPAFGLMDVIAGITS
jgi:hypothetical protein